MKLDRNNIHMNKPKKSESVGQTLPQLPWKRKRGDLKKNWFLSAFEVLKKFKMEAVAMVTKVQTILNSLQTADPFETWHKNRSLLKVVLFVFEIFKMATNIKIKTIVKNSKIKRFPWKWIFTGSKTCCTILRPFQFAMVAILNPKWPPKYKNPPFWYFSRHDSQKLGSNYFWLCSHTILHSYH